MSNSFYLTTALHYVNDEPHIGHAYETILGDVLARYFRLFGREVAFLTGVDEHGQKIVQAAAKAGLSPAEHCDRMADRFRSVWEQLNIEPDVFFRTTNPDHKQFVNTILQNLYSKGEIYSADYTGWYCTPDERFWTDKDVVDGKCPGCGRAVEQLTEKNYFFKMSSYQEWLIEHINTHPDFIKPESRRNEVLGFLKQPLGDLCISRPKARLAWGIPLPFDQDYVTYVWFDALLNYLSATRIHTDQGMRTEHWPADLHLIGKDIITTHAVYWPTMLRAAGFEPPKTIFAHGWWLSGGDKMSKSLGNVVKPLDLATTYGADPFRYVLMAEMTPGQDATFSPESFVKRYNSDLANDLGNLYSRLAKLSHVEDSAELPGSRAACDIFEPLLEESKELYSKIESEITALKPNAAIEVILAFVRRLNKGVEEGRLWVEPGSKQAAIKTALACLREASRLLEPIMPIKMRELQEAIAERPAVNFFPRITLTPTTSQSPSVGKNASRTAASPATLSPISIEDFSKIDLRVGIIRQAGVLEGSDKLLVLKVEIGQELRQIVAGIAVSYSPEELIGRRVVVVANLQPATLRGVVSEGMLLAASYGKMPRLISADELSPSGTRVR